MRASDSAVATSASFSGSRTLSSDRRSTASGSAPGIRSRAEADFRAGMVRRFDAARASALARPAITRSAVDLPQPEGPSSETNSLLGTSRSSGPSAMTPLSKPLVTARTDTARPVAPASLPDKAAGPRHQLPSLGMTPRANAFRVCREGKPPHTFPDHALFHALWAKIQADPLVDEPQRIGLA